MDNLNLLLSLLSGILIAWILVTNKQNQAQPHRALPASASRAPTTASTTVATPTKALMTKPTVVRVSGIRAGDILQAKIFVRTTIVERSGDKNCITDITIVPSCIDTETFVALVDFKILPDFLSSLNENRRQSHLVRVTDSYDLIFDVHFLGLTQTHFTVAPKAE